MPITRDDFKNAFSTKNRTRTRFQRRLDKAKEAMAAAQTAVQAWALVDDGISGYAAANRDCTDLQRLIAAEERRGVEHPGRAYKALKPLKAQARLLRDRVEPAAEHAKGKHNALTGAKRLVASLGSPPPDCIAGEVALLRSQFIQAAERATPADAIALLVGFEGRTGRLSSKATRFSSAHQAAKDRLNELKDERIAKAIVADLRTNKLDASTARPFEGGMALLTQIEEALVPLRKQVKAAKDTRKRTYDILQSLITADTDHRATIQIAAARVKLNEADQATDFSVVIQRLEEVRHKAAEGQEKVQTGSAFASQLAPVASKLTGLQGHRRRYVPVEQKAKALSDEIERIKASSGDNYYRAVIDIQKVGDRLTELKKRADDWHDFSGELTAAQQTLGTLRGHTNAGSIGTEISYINELLQTAAADASLGKTDGARATIAAAEQMCARATTLADGFPPANDTGLRTFTAQTEDLYAALDTLRQHEQYKAVATDGKVIADKLAALKTDCLAKSSSVATVQLILPVRRTVEPLLEAAKKKADDWKAHLALRAKARKALGKRKKHKHADMMGDELGQIEKLIKQAGKAAKPGDVKKGNFLIGQAEVLLADNVKYGDKLLMAVRKRSEVEALFEDSELPLARINHLLDHAVKLIATEDVSADKAKEMALFAEKIQEEEHFDDKRALDAARVFESLKADPDNIDPAVCEQLSRMTVTSGTASAEDAKVVAKKASILPLPILKMMKARKTDLVACRNSVTDHQPELAGVKPNGWPPGSTWDDVPGMHSPSTKSVVVATGDKDGKREIPDTGSGHGAEDLFGHEAGHGFDLEISPNRNLNAAFRAARLADVTATRMVAGRDNYFMDVSEGGTQTGEWPYKETFAESFGRHFSGKGTGVWTSLEAFWANNPWENPTV